MAFALTHCPPSAIEALLGVSSSLQTQVRLSETSFILCTKVLKGTSAQFCFLKSVCLPPPWQQAYTCSVFTVVFQHKFSYKLFI